MIKKVNILLIGFMMSISVNAQDVGIGEKFCYPEKLGSAYISVLQNTLFSLKTNKIDIYLGNDTVNPVNYYDSIPKSTYRSEYRQMDDFYLKYGINKANLLVVEKVVVKNG